jgi:hypothetical protein
MGHAPVVLETVGVAISTACISAWPRPRIPEGHLAAGARLDPERSLTDDTLRLGPRSGNSHQKSKVNRRASFQELRMQLRRPSGESRYGLHMRARRIHHLRTRGVVLEQPHVGAAGAAVGV